MNRTSITADELASSAVTIIDIRKAPDDRQIPGSIRLDGAALEDPNAMPPFDPAEPVVLYCGSGNSCSRIAQTLRDRGYDAVALEGGYKAWVESGKATDPRGA